MALAGLGAAESPQVGEGGACAHCRETSLARPCQWKGCPAPAWPQARVWFKTGTVTT